ncbi:hypothetical protein HW555_013647 [Spodoptera exigua]|uniref:Secreted protein n=1 Tax=Spodoptera exigua TaxID=7107 RepID=A0A835G4B0_SPOEX|nr:hypothetical protein HW555_013647 [Spodoptera exigua]
MVPTATTALQLLIAVCTINGLHSYPTRNRNPPLGILSELIGNNGKSPLIVVLSPDRGPKVCGDKAPSSLPARDESNGYHQHNKNDHKEKSFKQAKRP